MLDFMVIGLPRSGTTWVANWLTTRETFCLHDPLYSHHYSDLDGLKLGGADAKTVGVSCTALWRWGDWVNNHPAKKLIVHRDIEAINRSLSQLGLPAMRERDAQALHDLSGPHVHFDDLFCDQDAAAMIWDHLIPGVPFDPARHGLLSRTIVSPDFGRQRVDRGVVARLYSELSGIV